MTDFSRFPTLTTGKRYYGTSDLYPDFFRQLTFQFNVDIVAFYCYNVALEVPNASLNNLYASLKYYK